MHLATLQQHHRNVARLLKRLLRLLPLKLQRGARWIGLPPYTVFVIYAILTGALAGLAAVLFHDTIAFFEALFFHRSREVLGFLGSVQIVLLPALGMLIQSAMIALWPDIASRKGVLEVIKAVALRGGYIPLRVTLFHLIAPAVCMGSGGTVGPEGPAAQIGAGVASRFGHTLGLSDSRRRIFTAAGSGAAIAAIFNTPLGGVFFALEIALLNDFHADTFSALILASVTASALSRVLLGNEPAFAVGEVVVGSYRAMVLYMLLGFCAGALGVLFLRYSDWLRERFKRLLQRHRRAVMMAGVGLLVGLAGLCYNDIFGIGYSGINHLLRVHPVWHLALALLVLKFILVPLVLESGGFGGTFAPSLFMGAMLGYLFAQLINLLAPFTGIAVHENTYILVGMGSVLAALNSVPLAAIMIIFEMTNDYTFILPLMLGVVGSTLVVYAALRESVHAKRLRRLGYRLNAGREVALLQNLTAGEVMRPGDDFILPHNLPLEQTVQKCLKSPHESFLTQDENGTLTGTISLADLRQTLVEFDHLKHTRLVAQDIATPRVVTVAENEDLQHVMRLFGEVDVDELPVVSATEPQHVIGSIRQQDLISAYNKESLRRNLSEGVAHSLRTLQKTARVKVLEDHALLEMECPQAFVGKTLAELGLRSRYGVEVLMIQRPPNPFDTEMADVASIPDARYRIQEGDVLVVFGEHSKLQALERL